MNEVPLASHEWQRQLMPIDNPSFSLGQRSLVGYRNSCSETDTSGCSSLYFLSGIVGTVSVDLRFIGGSAEDETDTVFEDAVFGDKAVAAVSPFSSVVFFLSLVTDLNPHSVVTVKGSLGLGNTSQAGGSVMLVASEYIGNELWMYAASDMEIPCSSVDSTSTSVIFGNSLNSGEVLYTITPDASCQKLEMDATVSAPLSYCQTANSSFVWQLYSDFQCSTQPITSTVVNVTDASLETDVDPTVYCIVIGVSIEDANITMDCLSARTSADDFAAAIDLDHDGSEDSLLPNFLQNSLPIIGGSGAGAVVVFLLILIGIHKYQKSGLVDFAVGDIVIYKLTPAQQKRQRIHNLTKGYDYIKDKGFALVVEVAAPNFVSSSASNMEDPEPSLGKFDMEGRKTILCLQPLRRVARPASTSAGQNFFGQSPNAQDRQRRTGLGGTANSAITLIRDGEMELELAVDDAQRPVSCNYWGIRGGRVLSVVPILWRRRIKLEVPADLSDTITQRRRARDKPFTFRRNRGHEYEAASRSSKDENEDLPKKLEMLSFLDVTYVTNSVTGKGEWVNRAKLMRGLRRRSIQNANREDDLSPLSPIPGASTGKMFTAEKLHHRDVKNDKLETKRQTMLKEKRSKRESMHRTLLSADRKHGANETWGLWSLIRRCLFRHSMSESERKRMTKIQDETVRISSMPRKLRLHPGRNDLPVLFGGKEAVKKVWEKVARENDEEDRSDDDEYDEENWWKTNEYESEMMMLQPFLKTISRAETIYGRQSAAGIGFSFVVENCRELQLDQVAYSVWQYPYSDEQEEEQWQQLQREYDEYFDCALEEDDDDDFFIPEGEISQEEDDKFDPNYRNDDAGSLFELLPPNEEPSANRHRLHLHTHQYDEEEMGNRNRDMEAESHEDMQQKSDQMREAGIVTRRGHKKLKQKKQKLGNPNSEKKGSGGGKSTVSHVSPVPLHSSVQSHSSSQTPNTRLHRVDAVEDQDLVLESPLKSPPAATPGSKQKKKKEKNRTTDNRINNEIIAPNPKSMPGGGGGDFFVTPPHRMKPIVSRSTRVGGQQAVLSNDSTKSNSADKQYLMRVGDGLAVGEGVEGGTGKERGRIINGAGSKEKVKQQIQRQGQVLGSSLESDDDVDSAAVRQPGRAIVSTAAGQQQSHKHGTGPSPQKEGKTPPGRATMMASEGKDISQQAQQRRAERRRQRQLEKQKQQMIVEEID